MTGVQTCALPILYVFHFARRHLRVHACHAFAGAFVVTVSGKVLAGGGHLVVVLQAAHHFDAQFGYEVGRFAVNFFVASPALVASYVETQIDSNALITQTVMICG